MLAKVADDPIYHVATTLKSTEWRAKNEPKPKKPRQSRSKIKVMLIVFLDCRGVVHHEFVPEDQTVNEEYYLAVTFHPNFDWIFS